MKRFPWAKAAFSCAFALVSATAAATDYYVSADAGASDDNDGLSDQTPFATVDKAIISAANASDVIHVAEGTYATTNQWGPNLKAKLVGEGAYPDDVVIQSAGTYRTLRMAAGSWVENVTIVGEGTYKADKGGAIEMSGGTLTNCVVRDGTAKNNSANTEGGNLYVSGSSLVIDCEIYGGHATKRGGNVYLDAGTIIGCAIYGGVCDNVGGNVFQYNGTMSFCTIADGSSVNDGGNVRMNGSGTMSDCSISCGTNTATGDKKGANVYMDGSAKMSRCFLYGGVHTNYNGGSLCVYSSSAQVEDCLVEGSECGGVLLGGTSYIYNCTIVKNDKYGVWSWSNTQHIFNTVVYGNGNAGQVNEWTGNLPNSSTAEFLNCAMSYDNGRFTQDDFPTLVIIYSDDAFADYANYDYRPADDSPLIDAGCSDPRGASASATDYDGEPRLSGTIDIGCFEYQKSDMVVRITDATYDPTQAYAPATVTFAHAVENSASPENVAFTYDFGDGTTNETTYAATISHAYPNPGVYTVTIAAYNDIENEWATMVYDDYVQIASSTIYVTPGNGAGTFPYNTPATGYGNLKTAVQAAFDGYTLLLGEGVHETSDQISFNKALTLRGLGATPDAVVVSNTVATPNTYYHRTMEVNNAAAFVENITIANGCVRNQNGGNLRLVLGVVSNCVIRGGLVVADNGNAAGAAVELGANGVVGTPTLTHCVITNNVVRGTSNEGSSAGGAIYIPYGAKTGRISNCLIARNLYVPSVETIKAGTAGIRFNGSNDNAQIENNTIVANTVEGALTDDSAGVYCTTWYGRLRNNIIVGNYETEKGRYTSVKMDKEHGTYVNNITDAEASASSLFKNFAKGDFRPNSNGKAYNGGTNSGLTLLPSIDLAGNPRIFGKAIDVGCYECQTHPRLIIVVH
jgi:hypothetical protein